MSQQKKSTALGGDFELLDTDGRAFKLSSQRGKIVLIYFGYTGCPDACSTDLLLFRDVLSRLGSRKESVRPIFISVDPARDAFAKGQVASEHYSCAINREQNAVFPPYAEAPNEGAFPSR
jgi:cytochrome oxidase Cu insertion factor (SCO1/SenC/PrrC family)